jgi:protoporphyrinogen IX oxidase
MEPKRMYEWLKVLHLLADFAWMAGLFYLPRLFVYHASEPVGSATSETFKIMERRLLKAIMRPAAVVALVTGLGLLHVLGTTEPWVWVKLLGVLGLLATHGICEKYVKSFASDERLKPHRYFRIVNEIPTVALIIVVLAVIIRPFS